MISSFENSFLLKYRLPLYIIYHFSCSLPAQNLFPNPDFESYVDCPVSYSGINLGQCSAWQCIAGSPDYFNCAFYGVPAGQAFGSPSSGKGVVGMWGLINNLFCNGALQRESISAHLTEPIIRCETYKLTCDIRLDIAGPASIPGYGHDCLDFGFYFYKGADPNTCFNSCGCWNVEPQVSFSSALIPYKKYITLTYNFVAEDNFDKVAIGPYCNAKMNSNICLAPLDNSGPFTLYFNIDNLSLTHIVKANQILGTDTMLCQGDSLLIDATTGNAISYLWQDGSTLPTLKVFTPGTYTVQIQTECNILTDSIFVDYKKPLMVDLGPDSVLCFGDTIVLESTVENASYRWQNASNSNRFEVVAPGKYWVEITSQCLSTSDTINIIGLIAPIINFDTAYTICENQMVQLKAPSNYANYIWQDGSADSIYIVTHPGIYWVKVANNCGQASDTVKVIATDCDCKIYVPNVFMPQLENSNGSFFPRINCVLKKYEIMIYDKWGNKVFYSREKEQKWDGNFEGKACQPGVYAYLLTYTNNFSESFIKYGDITLIR